MKNKLTILAVLLCVMGNVLAQDEKILVGIKGGLNISTLGNTGGNASASFGGNSSSYKNKAKFLPHAGAYAEFKINDFFSVQPELLFTMRGYSEESKVVSGNSSSESKGSLTMSYIDIPVQARFNLGKGWHILGGPYLGILLAAKSKFEGTSVIGSQTTTTTTEDDAKDGLKSTDVGMYLGAGYEMEMGLSFGIRWCKGFTDITEPVGAGFGTYYYSANPTNTNSVFQFSVGYKLAAF